MNDTFIEFPLAVDGRGRTGITDPDRHLYEMIYQLLFTDPGERVNRPEFGCGVRRLVFAPNSFGIAAATQTLVKASLQAYLGDAIVVDSVEVTNHSELVVPDPDAVLTVKVAYTKRVTGESSAQQFTAPSSTLP